MKKRIILAPILMLGVMNSGYCENPLKESDFQEFASPASLLTSGYKGFKVIEGSWGNGEKISEPSSFSKVGNALYSAGSKASQLVKECGEIVLKKNVDSHINPLSRAIAKKIIGSVTGVVHLGVNVPFGDQNSLTLELLRQALAPSYTKACDYYEIRIQRAQHVIFGEVEESASAEDSLSLILRMHLTRIAMEQLKNVAQFSKEAFGKALNAAFSDVMESSNSLFSMTQQDLAQFWSSTEEKKNTSSFKDSVSGKVLAGIQNTLVQGALVSGKVLGAVQETDFYSDMKILLNDHLFRAFQEGIKEYAAGSLQEYLDSSISNMIINFGVKKATGTDISGHVQRLLINPATDYALGWAQQKGNLKFAPISKEEQDSYYEREKLKERNINLYLEDLPQDDVLSLRDVSEVTIDTINGSIQETPLASLAKNTVEKQVFFDALEPTEDSEDVSEEEEFHDATDGTIDLTVINPETNRIEDDWTVYSRPGFEDKVLEAAKTLINTTVSFASDVKKKAVDVKDSIFESVSSKFYSFTSKVSRWFSRA